MLRYSRIIYFLLKLHVDSLSVNFWQSYGQKGLSFYATKDEAFHQTSRLWRERAVVGYDYRQGCSKRTQRYSVLSEGRC